MLSEKQREIVENFSDNILLLARAGAGKTFTLAHKIAEAISVGVKPEEILAVTFTVKASEEIKEAVFKYSGGCSVPVYTIHGFCFSLVKEYARATRSFKEPTVADEIDSGEIMQGVLETAKTRGEYRQVTEEGILSARNLSKIISEIKHERQRLGFDWFSSGGYSEAVRSLISKSKDFSKNFTAKVNGVKVTDYPLLELLKADADKYIGEYQDALYYSSLMDFDDLIFCADALLRRGLIPAKKYKLVILDEVQDTSAVEYFVLRRFFSSAVVLLCGDEFQTIYAWRGSEPKIIIDDFVKNFNAKKITLGENRRSSEEIIYAGEYYLEKTFGYKTDNRLIDRDFKGGDVEIIGADGYDGEAEVVYEKLKNFEGKNHEICVMARSNRYIASLYRRLDEINSRFPPLERLKFFTAESDYQFYKKPIIKDFLAFLRLAVNPDDAPSLERVATKYQSGLTRRFLNSLRDTSVEGVSASGFLTEDAVKYSDNFHSLIKAYKEGKIVVYDLETTGLDTETDEPVQISALKFGERGKTAELNLFCLPSVEISEGAEKTHGFTEEKLKELGGISVKEALEKFSKFAEGSVLVGHNSFAFDDAVLDRISKEYGVEIKVTARADTLKIASLFRPDLKNRKLSTLCEEFGVINEKAHDAFSDVTATAEVLKAFITRYIIPTAISRHGYIEKNKGKFTALYEDYRTIRGLLLKNDLISLFKFIGEEKGVLKDKEQKDRESANDLYLALKEATARGKTAIGGVRKFLSDVALSGSQIDIMIKKSDKIPLITVHQSKGSEFDEVILVGADENEMPSYASRFSGSDEEEKRVFYVALTRAKKKFIVTYCKSVAYGDKIYERNPSPYIKNLPNAITVK